MTRPVLFGLALTLSAASPAVFPDKPTTGYKAVGMIGKVSSGVFSQSGCGVAISPDWVIGVSHVGGTVFLENGAQYPIVQKVIPKSESGEPADLALYKLGKPVPDFAKTAFLPFEDSKVGLKNRTVFLVGYGRTAVLRSDGLGWEPVKGSEGIRRVSANRIDTVGTERYKIGSALDPKWKSTICLGYDLDKPGDPSRSTLGTVINSPEGGIAAKDSGGGWFVSVNGKDCLVAISATVGRLQGSGLPTDYSYGAQGFGVHLAAYREWIHSVTGLPSFATPKVASQRPSPVLVAAVASTLLAAAAVKTRRR